MTKYDEISPFYHVIGHNIKIEDMEMSQNLVGPIAWMIAIMKYKPTMVIELGTCKGGFSSLISRCTSHIDAEFHTFDIRKSLRYPLYGNSTFHYGDWQQQIELIKSWVLRQGQCFFLCDNGNKPKEFNYFSDVIKPGDVIAAHDYADNAVFNTSWWWCSEIHDSDIKDTIAKNNLIPFETVWFDFSGWLVRQKALL